MANIKTKFPREYGHGRANYINGPLVAGASSLPAKLDQVISWKQRDGVSCACTWSGPKVSSFKHQASSIKLSNQPVQSPSDKHPNQSNKRQASSRKLQAP